MISHRRREFVAKNQLSFTAPLNSRDPDRSDDAAFINWAEGIKSTTGGRRSGAWARRSPLNGEFRWVAKDDGEIPSPRMWDRAGSPPQPILRAQLIAGYRQEMMDLVKNAPDSAYELSLKDLVEMPTRKSAADEAPARGKDPRSAAATKGPARNRTVNGGVFLLKLFFPFYMVGGNKGRGSEGGSGIGSRVSPKPIYGFGVSDTELGSKIGLGDSRSSSIGSSNSSISSSRNRKLKGCYSFLYVHRSKFPGDLKATRSREDLKR